MLRIIVAAFIALCLLYNVTLPVFEAPDEVAHYTAAAYLARERRLPDLNTTLPSHESSQPPLYYALVALIIAPFDHSNLAEISRLNPDWFDREVNPDFVSVSNQHPHGAAENFPYTGAVWGVRAARLFSTALGALTVALIFAIARLAAPNMPAAAPLAAALTAFNPKFIHIASIVSNDIAIIAAAAAACWWMCRLSRRNTAPAGAYAALGALIGVAVLSKLGGLGLLLPAAALLAAQPRQALQRALLIGAGLLIVCGPWLAYNSLSYGDPLAFSRVRAANASLLRDTPLALTDMLARAPAIVLSYAGEIGVGLRLPGAAIALYALIAAAGTLGLIVAIARRMRAAGTSLRTGWRNLLLSPAGVLALWQLALIALFAPWLRGYVATENGRLIMPGIACVTVGLAVGLATLSPALRRATAMGAGIGLLGVIAAAIPFTTIRPAFATPVLLGEAAAKAMVDAGPAPAPALRDVSFDGKFKIVAAGLTTTRPAAGEPVGVWLVWGALQPIEQSYRVQLDALDADGNVIARLRRIPFGGRFDTQRWAPGAFFRDDYRFPIAAAPPGPPVIAVKLSLFRIYGEPHTAPVDGNGADGVILGRVKLDSAGAPARGDRGDIATFGGAIALDRANIDAAGVVFTWRVLKRPENDYTLFVHVYDAAGNQIAQQDDEPFAKQYPTGLWEAGEQLRDRRTMVIPPEARRIQIGWYGPDGQRLPAVNAAGERWRDDVVVIER